MEPPRTLIPVTALVLVVALLGQRPDAREQKHDTTAGSGAQKRSAAGVSSSTKPSTAAEEPIKAYDVLAESFGIEITPDALQRRIRREINLAGTVAGPDERLADAKTFLLTFRRIAMAAGVKDAVRLPEPDPRSTANLTVSEVDELTRAVAAYFANPPANLTDLQIGVLQEVARRQGVPVKFLIATLPDPMDSFTGWQFDPMLDAIAQAVSASDFVFERFRFPDADGHGDGAPAGRAHENESNVILFHRHRDHTAPDAAAASGQAPELLVLLIVHENPSAGVHGPALLDALRVATSWQDQVHPRSPGAPRSIPILGPTFSGSSESMAAALGMAYRRQMLKPGDQVWVVTGSATDETNKAVIERALDNYRSRAKPAITFHATVQPDDVVLPELIKYMRSSGWPRPMAVLFEGNTQYGRSLKDVLERTGDLQQSDVILLPFPLNVSRVRDSAQDEKLGLQQALGLPSRFRPLSMAAPAAAVDQIPQLSPATTTSYVELNLSTLLQTMRTERVGTVAIMATDPRDKLFLAQRLAHDAPNVALMTVESDSIYYHPDYAYYMQGALVASTYPLYLGTQRWSYGFESGAERHVFANGSAEGTYNAALLLLNYDQSGRPIVAAPPRLVDYGVPGQTCAAGCEPPIWISVVGGRGAWPVRPAARSVDNRYVLPLSAGVDAAPRPSMLRTFPSTAFTAVFIVVTVLVGMICIDPRLRSGQWAMRLSGGGRVLSDEDQARRRFYAFVAVASVMSVEAFFVVVQTIRFRVEAADAAASSAAIGLARVITVAAVIPLAVLDVQIVRQAFRRDRAWFAHLIDVRHVDGWVRIIGTAVATWAVVNLAVYTWTSATLPPAEAASFAVRATNFSSGVSPALPILFLFAALALWGSLELARLRGPGRALADNAVQRLLQQSVSGSVKHLTGAWTELTPSAMRVRPALAWLVVIGVAGTCFACFDPFARPLVTIEGVHYGRFVSSMILLLQVMIGLSLLQFVYLWSVLERLLERLAYRDADAYLKVPRGLFPPGLFPRMPGLNELEVLVEHRASCLVKREPAAAQELQRTLEAERGAADPPHWTASSTWKALLAAAAVDASAGAAAIADAGRLREMCVTLVVRDAIARLWHNIIFVAAAVLCVFFSHALFPFQLQRALSELGWAYVALAFGAILTVLWQMRRNDFLRRVAASDPTTGKGWDTAFVLRLAIFVLIPLLTLFAAQFPDTGGVLMRWLEPVRKFLP